MAAKKAFEAVNAGAYAPGEAIKILETAESVDIEYGQIMVRVERRYVDDNVQKLKAMPPDMRRALHCDIIERVTVLCEAFSAGRRDDATRNGVVGALAAIEAFRRLRA